MTNLGGKDNGYKGKPKVVVISVKSSCYDVTELVFSDIVALVRWVFKKTTRPFTNSCINVLFLNSTNFKIKMLL